MTQENNSETFFQREERIRNSVEKAGPDFFETAYITHNASREQVALRNQQQPEHANEPVKGIMNFRDGGSDVHEEVTAQYDSEYTLQQVGVVKTTK